MKPRKPKDLYPETACELNLPVEAVEAVMGYFWTDVRNAATQLLYPRIHLANLGDLTLKHWLLDKYIKKYESIGGHTQTKSVRGRSISIQVNEKLNLLRRAKSQVAEEQQRREFIQQHKRLSDEAKQTKCYPYLEEQGSDPGRDPELGVQA